jgi:predicted lipid-binding transport protein (Tim44 family)
MLSERIMTLTTRISAAVLVAASLYACAGAPVQEMSDARQALAAAEQAHADRVAPSDVERARRLLEAAQAALDAGDFSTAREDAQLARQSALRALGLSQAQDVPPRSPP